MEKNAGQRSSLRPNANIRADPAIAHHGATRRAGKKPARERFVKREELNVWPREGNRSGEMSKKGLVASGHIRASCFMISLGVLLLRRSKAFSGLGKCCIQAIKERQSLLC